MSVEQIRPAELVEKIKTGEDWLILDVREPHELVIASLDGAIHVPMGEIPDRYRELPAERAIAVLCRSGARSASVCEFLENQGFEHVVNIDGGILKWAEDVDPTLTPY